MVSDNVNDRVNVMVNRIKIISGSRAKAKAIFSARNGQSCNIRLLAHQQAYSPTAEAAFQHRYPSIPALEFLPRQ